MLVDLFTAPTTVFTLHGRLNLLFILLLLLHLSFLLLLIHLPFLLFLIHKLLIVHNLCLSVQLLLRLLLLLLHSQPQLAASS